MRRSLCVTAAFLSVTLLPMASARADETTPSAEPTSDSASSTSEATPNAPTQGADAERGVAAAQGEAGGSSAPATATTSTAQQVPPLTSTRPVTVDVRVGAGSAILERRAATMGVSAPGVSDLALGSGAVWQPACVAPCVARLDPRYSYRLAGDGVVPTETFALPADADHARVNARLGSGFGRIAGITMAGVGAVGMLAGGGALVASPVLASQDVGSSELRTGILVGGAGTLALAALVTGAGIYLWATNSSSVEVQRLSPTSIKASARVRLTPQGVAF